jgi:hypothetical protein
MRHDASLTKADTARARLDALVAQRMVAPFVWGVQDCCLWAADCVQAMTGTDHAADVRGTYSTAAGALRVLQQLGGIEAMGARAGAPIPPLAAGVGDVGLIVLEDRSLLAVCMGAVWLAPAAQGLAARPLGGVLRAWRVSRG